MFDKPQATHVVGTENDGSTIRAVALSLTRGKLHVDSFFDFSPQKETDNEGNFSDPYTAEQKNQLGALARRYMVVSSMEMENVLVRTLELKLKKQKDIDAVFISQAEPIIPYPIENGVLDKFIAFQDKESTRLTVLAVRKDHLNQHIKEWNELHVEPEVVSAEPQALALFANYFAAQTEPFYALHLGVHRSLCVLIDQGKLINAQSIPMGVAALLGKEIDSSSIEPLRQIVTRTIYALAKQLRGKKIDKLLLVGVGSSVNGLPEALTTPISKSLIELPQEGFSGFSKEKLKEFALPIGAALSALPLKCDQINFRQKEFSDPSPWKRLKKPLAIYFILCFALAIAIHLFGDAYVDHQEVQVKESYLKLLDTMNKPYIEFEKEFTAKNPSDRDLPFGETIAIKVLTKEEIQSRLKHLEKEIQATPQIFPLQPHIPLVSDVLAWLGTHPAFAGLNKGDGEAKEGEDAPQSLQIETFHYVLVKRPEPNKKQEKYQVKIDLDFTSPSPKMAREFHDALITPNEIVDPKAEIKWNSNRDGYHTSFYLKDKTIYPILGQGK